jgi:hypothetical protein
LLTVTEQAPASELAKLTEQPKREPLEQGKVPPVETLVLHITKPESWNNDLRCAVMRMEQVEESKVYVHFLIRDYIGDQQRYCLAIS